MTSCPFGHAQALKFSRKHGTTRKMKMQHISTHTFQARCLIAFKSRPGRLIRSERNTHITSIKYILRHNQDNKWRMLYIISWSLFHFISTSSSHSSHREHIKINKLFISNIYSIFCFRDSQEVKSGMLIKYKYMHLVCRFNMVCIIKES